MGRHGKAKKQPWYNKYCRQHRNGKLKQERKEIVIKSLVFKDIT